MSDDGSQFHFIVRRPIEWDDDEPKPGAGWLVELPHQCGPWEIAGNYGEGITHADAVAELEQFITEAQAALVALRAEREQNAEDS